MNRIEELEATVLMLEQDARRYLRLRIIGVAPNETKQLAERTVIRFQTLDEYCDSELRAHPSRGEFNTTSAASRIRKEIERKAKVEAFGEAASLADEYDLCNETGDTLKELAASFRRRADELERSGE